MYRDRSSPEFMGKSPDDFERLDLRNLVASEFQLVSLRNRLAKEHPSREVASLMDALYFGEQTCKLARAAAKQGASLHLMILARPLLELSVRLLWAVQVSNGWARYRLYQIEQAIEASDHGEPFIGRRVGIDRLKEVKRRALLRGLKPMRYKLPSVLSDILDEERKLGWPVQPGAHEREHFLIFKLAHQVTHGNPEYLAENRRIEHMPDGTLDPSNGLYFHQAVYMLTKAVYRHAMWPDFHNHAANFIETFRSGRVA